MPSRKAFLVAAPLIQALLGHAADEVVVGGIPLEPMAHLHYLDDRLVVHPNGLLGIGYDSNVFQNGVDERSDSFLEAIAALEAHYFIAEGSQFITLARIHARDYLVEDDRDLLGGELAADWHRKGPIWSLDSGVRYQRIDDPLVETGRTVERQELRAHLQAVRTGNLTETGGHLFADRQDYLEDAASFDADERDRSTIGASIFVRRELAEESSIRGTLGYAKRNYDEETSQYQDSDAWRVTGRYRLPVAQRARLDIELGIEARFFDDSFSGEDGFDDQELYSPVGAIRLDYPYSDAGAMHLEYRVALYDSVSANAALVHEAAAGLRHRLAERWRVGGALAYLNRRDQGSLPGSEPISTDTWRIDLSLEMLLRKGIAVGLRGTGYSQHSNVAFHEYDRVLVGLACGIAF